MPRFERILTRYSRVALVGASAKPERPSHGVMGFLLRHGFTVTPVNPGLAGQTIHGQTVVAATLDEAAPLEIVDVFRASDQVGPVVADAIRLGAKVVWMQLGVVNREAAEAARAAGIMTVIMDRCPGDRMAAPRAASGPRHRGGPRANLGLSFR